LGLLGIFKRPKRKPKRGPREDLPPEIKLVVSTLQNVIDPETGLNVVEEGLL
jgi:metal-sulfur cluster biosynthetic enzyme